MDVAIKNMVAGVLAGDKGWTKMYMDSYGHLRGLGASKVWNLPQDDQITRQAIQSIPDAELKAIVAIWQPAAKSTPIDVFENAEVVEDSKVEDSNA